MTFKYYDYRVKKFNDSYFKHIYLKRSISSSEHVGPEREEKAPNESKLANNISRARSRIFEYAMCNDFEYFVTLTLNGGKRDRFDLQAFSKDFAQFVRNHRKQYDSNIEYLLIPETHKDGAYHMHGFIKGIPFDQLRIFTLDEKLSYYIRKKLKKNQPVYGWSEYADRFGHIVLDPIQDKERCAKYMTKYVSECMAETVTELGAHVYYVSRGLNIAETIYTIECFDNVDTEDMEINNDFVMIKFTYTFELEPDDDSFDRMIYFDVLRRSHERAMAYELVPVKPVESFAVFTNIDFEQLTL